MREALYILSSNSPRLVGVQCALLGTACADVAPE